MEITDKLELQRTSEYLPLSMKLNVRRHEFHLGIVRRSWSMESSAIQPLKSKRTAARRQLEPNLHVKCLSSGGKTKENSVNQ